MKKLIKWLLGLVASLVVLVVLAIIILPWVFDPNDHKPRIQQLAAEQIGREVQLNGPIEWSVFPTLAINLQDVTVANESGFKGDHLATVQRVAVKVQLWPLLQQQIKVGQVELQQPNIQLQVAQSGNSNWQSLLDHLASDPSNETTASDGTALEIRGIEISDGQLRYVDASADLTATLQDLNFNSDAIKANTPTDMFLDADLAVEGTGLAGRVQAAWQATGLTGDAGVVLQFAQLSLTGEVDQVPLTIQTQGLSVLNLADDSLNFSSLDLSYANWSLTTPVQGQQITGDMTLAGQLSMPAFALDDLLNTLGSPLKNQADNELGGELQWRLHNDRLQLQNIMMQLDGSTLTGEVDLRQLSQMQGQFSLSLDQLDLDQYLPAVDSAGGAAGDDAAMDLGRLNGQITMGQLKAAGVQLNDITLNIATQGPNIVVEPLKAGFYQGLIKTELRLQPEQSREKLQITHQMRDFQAGGLLADLMGTEYLTGLGQLDADLRIDEPFSERPLQSAQGSLSYQLTDGDLVGIDVFEIIQRSLSLLNKTEAAQTNEDLRTAFGLMDLQADINNGILKTKQLRLTSPYFDVKGEVTIDLDQQTIQGTIKPMLTNIPADVLDKNLAKLINVRIPVNLSGNLLEPAVKVDVAQLLLATQKAKIDEKKDELKEELFDALLGSKKDDNKPAQGAGGETDKEPVEMTEKERKRAEKDRQKRELLEGLFNTIQDKDKDKDQEGDTDGDT
ncbi:AsmA family protein [Marinicella meishanensis]|uniref:AsmA family protein n=1 Tax=Marinicella meishanensis TaxID=2873263 RepID=UPI001CBE539D|nr:AsmA family protein [Marinicella sp. NBU2979]